MTHDQDIADAEGAPDAPSGGHAPNRGAPVDGGSYEIVAEAPGFRAWTTTVVVAAEAEHAAVEIPRLVALPATPVASIEVTRRGPPPHASSMSGRRKLALGLVGVGVVAAGAEGRHRFDARR